MSKKNNREELLRLGNFKIEGIRDVFGHQTLMQIRTTSGNWITKIDESTFMFGLVKSIIGMAANKTETKQWMDYLQSLINVQYQFATSGCPVEVLVEIGKLLLSYQEKVSNETNQPTEEEEKKTIDDMKREKEMKDELKNIEESKSEYVGQVGEKITIETDVYNYQQKDSPFGVQHTCKLLDNNGNKYIVNNIGRVVKKGDTIQMTAKVKEHKELLGVKFTVLYYCKISNVFNLEEDSNKYNL